MSRIARLWNGAGLLTLGGVLLSGVVARGDDGPPLATQLNDLGRQALAQGASSVARTFFQKALQLDPGNAEATRGLKDSKAATETSDAGGLPGGRASPAASRGSPGHHATAGRRRPRHPRPRNLLSPKPRSRRASRPRTSPGNSLPMTSSSVSRRLATRSPLVSPAPHSARCARLSLPFVPRATSPKAFARLWTRESRLKCCSPSAMRSGS